MDNVDNARNQAAAPEAAHSSESVSPSAAPRKRSLVADPVPWSLLAVTLGLDQLTKAIVVGNLSRGESWPEEGFFRFTHAWNTGTAFSLLQDQGTLLTFISFVAVIALYFVYRSLPSPNIWVRMAFGLLLGGAFGNLIDRLRLGHVTDFIDVGPWPIFNVADSAIVVGIAVLFLNFWIASDRKIVSAHKSATEPRDSEKSSGEGTQSAPGSE